MRPLVSKSLKPNYDKMLSNVAFKFNLRRYIKDDLDALHKDLRELAAAEKSDVDAVRKDLAALDKKSAQSKVALEVEALRKEIGAVEKKAAVGKDLKALRKELAALSKVRRCRLTLSKPR